MVICFILFSTLSSGGVRFDYFVGVVVIVVIIVITLALDLDVHANSCFTARGRKKNA